MLLSHRMSHRWNLILLLISFTYYKVSEGHRTVAHSRTSFLSMLKASHRMNLPQPNYPFSPFWLWWRMLPAWVSIFYSFGIYLWMELLAHLVHVLKVSRNHQIVFHWSWTTLHSGTAQGKGASSLLPRGYLGFVVVVVVIAIFRDAVGCYSFAWLHTSIHGPVFSSVTSLLRSRMFLNLGQQTTPKVLGKSKMAFPKILMGSQRLSKAAVLVWFSLPFIGLASFSTKHFMCCSVWHLGPILYFLNSFMSQKS